jgi:hypothetical protein
MAHLTAVKGVNNTARKWVPPGTRTTPGSNRDRITSTNTSTMTTELLGFGQIPNHRGKQKRERERARFVSTHERRQGRKPENQNEREKRDL